MIELRSGGETFQPPNVDGIWGLGYKHLSNGRPTVFDQLVATGAVSRDIFAITMGREVGMLHLGSDGAEDHKGPAQYTPIVNESFYVVDLQAMSVGGNRLDVPSSVFNAYQTIVDSGSTDIIVPVVAHTALKQLFRQHCPTSNLVGVCSRLKDNDADKSLFEQFCYDMTPEEVAAFPVLDFEFPNEHGGTFKVHVPSYLYLQQRRCEHADAYQLAIDKPIVAHGSTVLGDVFMSAYVVIHDRESRRLGFAPASTHISSLTSAGSFPDDNTIATAVADHSGLIVIVFLMLLSVSIVFAPIVRAKMCNKLRTANGYTLL